MVFQIVNGIQQPTRKNGEREKERSREQPAGKNAIKKCRTELTANGKLQATSNKSRTNENHLKSNINLICSFLVNFTKCVRWLAEIFAARTRERVSCTSPWLSAPCSLIAPLSSVQWSVSVCVLDLNGSQPLAHSLFLPIVSRPFIFAH